jgi:hypothetical protein
MGEAELWASGMETQLSNLQLELKSVKKDIEIGTLKM